MNLIPDFIPLLLYSSPSRGARGRTPATPRYCRCRCNWHLFRKGCNGAAQVIEVHNDQIRRAEDLLSRAYIVHAKGLKGEEAKQFAAQVKVWVTERVAKHKYLRGGKLI